METYNTREGNLPRTETSPPAAREIKKERERIYKTHFNLYKESLKHTLFFLNKKHLAKVFTPNLIAQIAQIWLEF